MRTATLPALAGLLISSSALAGTDEACPKPKGGAETRRVDPRLRATAQRGLDYLVRASKAWTEQHKCYGCHVQAVTLEGLTVGKHNKYRVAGEDIAAMVAALDRGVTAGGRRTGIAFQAAAWARYDQWVDAAKTDQLLRYAEELLEHQTPDGAIPDDDRRPPVVAGTMQTTYQAMQAWRQAYARTADEAWLPPMRRAEAYLANTSRAWEAPDDVSLLDLDYALMGLVAAGVKGTEPASQRLQRMIVARQNDDGGFGLDDERSDALATGQALYALKLAGYADQDAVITRGHRWLVEHQKDDGRWGTVKSNQRGADMGEAMWAVLGLVSVDVMSLSVAGLSDGQRLDGAAKVELAASAHGGGGVRQVEIMVDDISVAKACGPTLTHTIRPDALPEGKHRVETIATNEAGQVSRRVFEVYTGDVYMTQVGARYDERAGRTEISLRNIASSPKTAGRIRLEIRTEGDAPATIYGDEVPGRMGPMALTWAGRGNDGKARPSGRYTAVVHFLDRRGRALQTERVVFSHESAAARRKKYAEVQGQVRLQAQGGKSSANTIVELVDKAGNVVRSTRTTAQGNYRFKDVDAGKYRVRVKKRGWRAQEAEVEASKASAPATADVNL